MAEKGERAYIVSYVEKSVHIQRGNAIIKLDAKTYKL